MSAVRGKTVAAKPLWTQIFDELKTGIESGVFPADTSLPPELEIAAKWGVSRLTAHRALYELQREGLVTRKRNVGTVVLPPKPKTALRVSTLIFHAGDFFQGKLLAAVRAGLAEESHLSYVDTNRDATSEAAALEKMRDEADCIVLYPTCDPANDALLRDIARTGPPLVFLDRHPEGVPCDSVQTDNYAATRWVLNGLLREEHRRIACFCDFETPVSSTADRVRAYRDALEMADGDSHRHFFAFPYYAPESEAEFALMVDMARDALVEALDGDEPPTALFCTREHYAAAAVEACAQLGRPPLQIAAFVDRPSYLMALPDSVRRVTQDLDTMGRTAADRAVRRAGGEKLPVERILVPCLEQAREALA